MSAADREAHPTLPAEQAGWWCVRIAESPLTPDEAAAFEAWLNEDPSNRSAFDRALLVWQALGTEAASPELLDGRLDALESLRVATAPRRTASHEWRWAAVAATLLVALLTVFFLMQGPVTTFQTGVGERRIVILEDGSRVSLDGATRVEAEYSGSRRNLRLLAGRARFDVEADPLRPFVVAAGRRAIVAVGTSFSVELVRDQTRIVLYEGQVAVLDDDSGSGRERPQARLAAATRELVPGREMVFSPQASEGTMIELPEPERSLSWETGQLSFADEPLDVAVERVNRHARLRFVVGDAIAANTRISGVFNAGDAESFLDGVTSVFPVTARRRGDEIILSAAPDARM